MYTSSIKNVVPQATYNQVTQIMDPRPAQDILTEEIALLTSETATIQAKIDAYEAAKLNQLSNGGPGPVADFETMKICNEHNGLFIVEFS